MLDEKGLRKPGFSDGYPVTLADGQVWVFPGPRLRLHPRIGADGRVEIAGGRTFGPEMDSKLDVLFSASDDGSGGWDRLGVQFEVVVRLLLANYDLAPVDVETLLVYEPGDPASDQRWDEILEVVLGAAPKPSPAT